MKNVYEKLRIYRKKSLLICLHRILNFDQIYS